METVGAGSAGHERRCKLGDKIRQVCVWPVAVAVSEI